MRQVLTRLKRLPTSEGAQPWRPALVVHVMSLVIGFFLLLWLNRNQWFVADEWHFLAERGFGPGNQGLFEPANEHWSTIPILIYRGLFSLFGVRTYTPYIAVLLLLHVGVAHLVWRVMRSSSVEPWIATVACAIFLLLEAGYENIQWAYQIGFIGSLLFGLGHVLLADHSGPFGRRDIAGWGLSFIGLMFSGIAVPMTATAGVVALIRRGWRALLLTVAPAGAVYIVWLATVGSAGLTSEADMFRLPLYVASGIRGTINGLTVTELTMPLLVPVVLLLGVVGSMQRRTRPAAAVACAVGSVLIFGVTGIGRISEFGVEYAASSRYVYLAAALLLPLVGMALTLLASTSSLARIAVLLFLSVGVVTNLRLLYGRLDREARRDQLVQQTLLAAAAPSAFQGPLLGDRPEPQFAGALQLQDLIALRADGALPTIRTISTEARLQAAANLQVSLSAEPRLASEDRSAVLVAGAATTEAGCISIDPRTSLQRPTAVIGVSEPVSIGIRSDVAGEIEVLIRRDGTITPLPRTFRLSEGRTSFLNLAVLGSEAIVRLPSTGETTLCNLRLP